MGIGEGACPWLYLHALTDPQWCLLSLEPAGPLEESHPLSVSPAGLGRFPVHLPGLPTAEPP